MGEFIWIFIRPISLVKNIFGYSFVQKNYIRPTLVQNSDQTKIPTKPNKNLCLELEIKCIRAVCCDPAICFG